MPTGKFLAHFVAWSKDEHGKFDSSLIAQVLCPYPEWEKVCYVYSDWYYRLSWPPQVQPWMMPPDCESTDKFGTKIYFSDEGTKMDWNSEYVAIILSFF